MILLDDIKRVFVDKLASTHSLDAALLKATWIAYNQGLEDGRNERTREMEAAIDANYLSRPGNL